MRTHYAVLAEVAEALRQHAALRCAPVVEMEDGAVLLTLRVEAEEQPGEAEALDVLELFQDLLRVADVAQLRGFAQRHDIEPRRLEALLDRKGEA